VWSLFSVLLAVGLLTIMIAWGKVQPLLAFVVAALVAALMLGMPLAKIPGAIEKGIGDLLGSLVVVICLGAVFGKLIADSGAARRIAISLIATMGPNRMPVAMTITGFVVGLPLYYNVGFVLMIPLIFSLVYQSGRPAVALGMPLAGGPVDRARLFAAASVADRAGRRRACGHGQDLAVRPDRGHSDADHRRPDLLDDAEEHQAPSRRRCSSASRSRITNCRAPSRASPPRCCRWRCSACSRLVDADPSRADAVAGVLRQSAGGDAGVVRGGDLHARHRTRPDACRKVMDSAQQALREIAPILLIIAGAGGLKQVMTESGISAQLGAQLASLPDSAAAARPGRSRR
jgi:hypothetical protein